MSHPPIKINKHDAALIRFLQSAASTDPGRPTLNGIYVNGTVMSCDGFRAHAVPSVYPLNLAFDNQVIELDKKPRAAGDYVEPTVTTGTYPKVEEIVPKDPPTLEIGVNPQYLMEALAPFIDKKNGSTVTLRFRTPAAPIEVYGDIEVDGDITPGYALIMPRHLDDQPIQNWKP